MATEIDDEVIDLAQRIPLIAQLEREEAEAIAKLADIRVRLQEAKGQAAQRVSAIRGKLSDKGGVVRS